MKIPSITDEMLVKVVEVCVSPGFVIFSEVDSSESVGLRRMIGVMADEFDDRVIFLGINADENPTVAKAYAVVRFPAVIIIKRGRVVGRATEGIDPQKVEDLIERAVAAL